MLTQHNVQLNAIPNLNEMQLHRISRAMFDLIPGMLHEFPETDSHRTFWTKNTTIGLGQKKLLLVVFCDEPPICDIVIPEAGVGNLASKDAGA